jgi:3-hydroxyisobutyrate dehydrogenase
MTDSVLPRIGFMGLGIMGAPMAGHLLAAGHPLTIANRSRGPRVQALLDAGAKWAETSAALAATSDVVITILGFPQDVEQVWLGAAGLLDGAKPGTLLLDMTTSSPRLAMRLAEATAARGCAALDAPVSGGEAGARNATLSIMVGGDASAFATAQPMLARLGKTVRHMGGAGAGQHTKMANQIAIASAVMGVAEALSYARRAGLNGEAVVAALAPGAATSFQLTALGPKMLAGDYAPGFMVKHFLKDLGIALAEAETLGLDLPGVVQARELFERIVSEVGEDVGTQAIIAAYGP